MNPPTQHNTTQAVHFGDVTVMRGSPTFRVQYNPSPRHHHNQSSLKGSRSLPQLTQHRSTAAPAAAGAPASCGIVHYPIASVIGNHHTGGHHHQQQYHQQHQQQYQQQYQQQQQYQHHHQHQYQQRQQGNAQRSPPRRHPRQHNHKYPNHNNTRSSPNKQQQQQLDQRSVARKALELGVMPRQYLQARARIEQDPLGSTTSGGSSAAATYRHLAQSRHMGGGGTGPFVTQRRGFNIITNRLSRCWLLGWCYVLPRAAVGANKPFHVLGRESRGCRVDTRSTSRQQH